MKKFSVIIASLVLFAGITFAQNSSTMPNHGTKNAGGSKGTSGSTSGSTSGTSSSAGTTSSGVKKVPPPAKGGAKAVPAVKANPSK